MSNWSVGKQEKYELEQAEIDVASLQSKITKVVHNTGDEKIAGVKTFTSIPVLPANDPTTDNQAVRKKYVDDHAGGVTDHGDLTGLADDDHTQYLNNARHDTTTRHTIGTVVPHDAQKADDSAVVHDTGDETIAGVKTFSSIPVLPASDPTSDNQAARKAYVDGLFEKPIPLSINSCIYWWDFSDPTKLYTLGPTHVVSDGDLIQRATSLHDDTIHATQVTSANRPAYKTAIQNSKSAALFDGTDDYLAGPINTNLSAGCSVFVVANVASLASNRELVSVYNGVTSGYQNRFRLLYLTDGTIRFLLDQNAVGTAIFIGRKTNAGAVAINNTYLIEGHYNGGTLPAGVDIFKNGVEVDAIDDTLGTFTGVPSTTDIPIRIGYQFDTGSAQNPFSGHIMEIIVYNAEIADADKLTIRNYLNTKWNIY